MPLIRDRYELLGIAGQGGQGEVLKAIDTLHNRLVALKLRRVASKHERDSILQEARMLLDMTPHPNVSRVRDDFFEADRYYLVMDWIEGIPLDRLIQENGTLSVSEVVDLLRPVAEAVDHLHTHEPPLIHGDIKPANIIQTSERRPVLVDFGVSARGDIGPHLTTTSYRAPELRLGEPGQASSDLYALAATVYTLLFGQPPLPGVPPDWSALGIHDAARLERVLRLGLAFDPARRPSSAAEFLDSLKPPPVPNNLSAPVTTFVGREEEIARIKELLSTTRLLTLTGIGGVGKTRLALQSAATLMHNHPGGVWCVALANIGESELVPSALQRALGISDQPGRLPLQLVHQAIGASHALLILDNCEHLLEACTQTAAEVLSACPNARVVATSREPLQMLGEQTYEIGPLSSPSEERMPEELERFDAVRLFMDRARAADPDLRLTDDVAPAVGRIAAGLDGIPLAIELAAAQASSRTLMEIAAGLDDRFELLAGGNRAALPRQQTLRALIDWSYGLLNSEEQRAFRSLGVFTGSFFVDSVAEICGQEVEDLLPAIASKSLITRADEDRYAMLETIKRFTEDRLREAGERDALAAGHRSWFLVFAEVAKERMAGPEQGATTARLEEDQPNLRSALAGSLEYGEIENAARIAVALFDFWYAGGHWNEGQRWLEAVLERGLGLGTVLRARASLALGHLRHAQGNEAGARAAFDQSLAAARQAEDDRSVASALHGLGNVIHDNQESERLYEEAHTIMLEIGDRVGAAKIRNNLGIIAATRGDESAARIHYEEFIGAHREIGDGGQVARGLANLGLSHMRTGETERGRDLLTESLELYRSLGNKRGVSQTLNSLANLEAIARRPDDALRWANDALDLAREMGSRKDEATALSTMGSAAMRQGKLEDARELLSEAVEILKEIGDDTNWPNFQVPLAMCVMNLEEFGLAASLCGEALRKIVELGNFVLVPSAVTAIAAVADDSGTPDVAARLLGAVESMYVRNGVSAEGLRESLVEEFSAVVEDMGTEAFEAAYEKGKAFSQDETLAEAYEFVASFE